MTRVGISGPPPIPVRSLPKETEAQVELERTSFGLSWKSVLLFLVLFVVIFSLIVIFG